MADTLKLEIVTPEAQTLSQDVEMVTLPGTEGEMGIYPHHVPLMTQLAPGEIIVRMSSCVFIRIAITSFLQKKRTNNLNENSSLIEN